MLPDDHLEKFLISLMACNADDGQWVGVPGMLEMRGAVRSAWEKFKDSAATDAISLLPQLKIECLGDPDMPRAPLRPASPPYVTFLDTPLDVAELSTVVTLQTFLKLIHDDDKPALEAEGIPLAVTGSSDGETLLSEFEDMLGSRLPMLHASQRRFRISPDESHGRPYVWFTAKDDLSTRISEHSGPGRSRADVARDALGLIHHGPIAYRSRRPNHLVALHFPSGLAERAGHVRPSAIQAFDNRRFVLTFDNENPSTAADWGRTIDLHTFRTRMGVLPSGCRERLLLRLQASLFEPDEHITFDYLGKVGSTRGDITGRDDDSTFLELVARDRLPDKLVRLICDDE